MSESTSPETSARTAVAVLAAIIGALLAVGVLTIINGSWLGLIAIVIAAAVVPALLNARAESGS